MRVIELVRTRLIVETKRDDQVLFQAFVYPQDGPRNLKVEVTQSRNIDDLSKWKPAVLHWPSSSGASGEEAATFGLALQMAVDLVGQRNILTGAV